MNKPRRFIIEIHDNIDFVSAFTKCAQVVKLGMISGEGKQHCYGTVFPDGVMITVNLNKGGSERFRVSKTTP